jgi:hypothetical protein
MRVSKRHTKDREVPIVRGTKDDRDPEHLLATTDEASIAEWFACVERIGIDTKHAGGADKRGKRSARSRWSAPVYTDFEKRAFVSLAAQFQKNRETKHAPLLTGSQLVLLRKLVVKAEDVALSVLLKAQVQT